MTTQSTERGTFWRFKLAMLLTFALMIGTAGLLWSFNDDKARGAAIALASAAATHLIKETQRLVFTAEKS